MIIQVLLEGKSPRFLFLLFVVLLLKSYFIGNVSNHNDQLEISFNLDPVFLKDNGAIIFSAC